MIPAAIIESPTGTGKPRASGDDPDAQLRRAFLDE